ncbi:peptide deformylase [Streptomyces sp. NBC_01497]|uniref:peptide deformylase n=1 Tax=Streptomyces sp. NBC_01497 TaxID=2903885 RepID=UPI002E307960|nr:peptide deformylase [Streptomyces sp. NBC_01497]
MAEAEPRGAVRPITLVGDDILRRRCRPAGDGDFGTPALDGLIEDMFATNAGARGAAIAANQVGVDLRLFVWDMDDDWGVRHTGHILNPVLDDVPAGERRLVEEPEGCLSVPGPYRVVPRTDVAVVRGYDARGEPVVVEGRGYFARCLQHETDHLHGRLYLDRLAKRERAAVLREMEELRGGVAARRAEQLRPR